MAATEQPTGAAQPPEVQPQSQPQPEPSSTTPKLQRKSSFSDALNKFASNTFNRRRTTTNLPHSTSLASVHTQSRLPTLAGIPRSTSFFTTLNNFKSATTVPAPSTRNQIKSGEKSKTTNTDGNDISPRKENRATFPKSTSTSRIPIAPASTPKKVAPNLAPSHRRVSTPYCHLTSPVTPTSTNTHKSKTSSNGNANSGSSGKSKSRRESGVQITQHKLLQPLPPPLPKANSTMSSLMTGSSANVVGSARTSLSGKRDSGVMVGGNGNANATANVNANASVNANVTSASNVINANNVTNASSSTTKPTETETETPGALATMQPLKANSPSQTQPKTQSPTLDINKPLPDFHTNPLYIKTPQPPAYWCGRLSALNDRFRMEDITNTNTSSPSSSASPSSSTQLSAANRKLSDDERRTRRIFVHLQGLCVTDEARKSLDEFQVAYERKLAGKGGGGGGVAEKGKAVVAKGGGAGTGVAEAKGAGGFLDKLRGRR